jgi:hypothetical protein
MKPDYSVHQGLPNSAYLNFPDKSNYYAQVIFNKHGLNF